MNGLKAPRFSIITVNLNNREGLRRTIESVARQTLRDFELIVIDGGSNDGSTDVLRQHKEDITFWVSEPDSGIYNAMNKGIRLATGDYLNFMNSGDCFYDDGVLARVAGYHSEADIIVGRDYHYDQTTKRGHASVQPERLTMAHFFMATIDHQSSFIRRELFSGNLYREDFRLVSDWIFFTEQIVCQGRQVDLIPDIVCRREEGGLSEQQRNLNRQETDTYLRQLLPSGVYADYVTLSKLDRITLYRLLDICGNDRQRKLLTWCVKIIKRLFPSS